MSTASLLFTVTLFVGIAILIGGLIGKGMYGFLPKQINLLYIISGGILIGLLIFELIPEIIMEYKWVGVLLGLGVSLILMFLMEGFFQQAVRKYGIKNQLQSIIFLVIAIAFHNIPTGLAVGVNIRSTGSGITPLIATVIFHQVPEGIAIIIATILAGYSMLSFIVIVFFLAGVIGVSSCLSAMFVSNSIKIDALLMGGAIGTLGYVSMFEILWKSKQKVGWLTFVSLSLLGLFVMKIYLYFIDRLF